MTLKKRPASFAWYALGERIFIYLEHEDSVDTISLIMAQKATLGRLTKSFILMKKKKSHFRFIQRFQENKSFTDFSRVLLPRLGNKES